MTAAERVLNYLSAFSSADPDEIVCHVTEDFENNQISELGTGCRGRAVYRERLVGFLKTFRDLHYTAEEIIADGDRVAVAYRMTAAENGYPIELQGVMLITLCDGLIGRRDDYWDGLTYRKQLGTGEKE